MGVVKPLPDPWWPTTLFRVVHPAETPLVCALLDVPAGGRLVVYVVVEAGQPTTEPPPAAVAVEISGGSWLLRAAYGVDDPQVAARIHCELVAEAVRAGASTIAAPVESSPACRAVMAAGRREQDRNGWLVAEL